MIAWDIIERLLKAFPRSIINGSGEFVAHTETGEFFMLANCATELDVKCKILEWFSRGAYKTEPYRRKKDNDQFHKFMLDGINTFLGTRFTEGDMQYIYTYLGNSVRHNKTIEFIEGRYNMSFFRQFDFMED